MRAVECPADIIDQMAAGTGRVLGRAMVGDIRWSSCTVGWLRLWGRLVRLMSRELLITVDWLT